MGISLTLAIIILAIVAIWSIIWKGIALWKSAKKNHLVWFIVFLITNTIGILEILYIYIFSEMKFNERKSRKKQRR
ncbi:hypothetical protein J4221_00180 [Candidatus Pacearchaeota archaeon]|nr:hypothetical protein [Candidatus Pacearchaeota archaeon]